MASARSLYDILNVSPDAEGVVIEAAYRALMKKYHPDQAAGGESSANGSAAEINQAFAVLRDPKRRAGYDLHERSRQPVQLTPVVVHQPPRRSGFAWTGWLVALLLGAILYAVLNGRGGLIVPPVQGSSDGNKSTEVETDRRTQPVKIAPAMEAAAPTALDREILLDEAKAKAASESPGVAGESADAALEPEPEPVIADDETASLQLRTRATPPRTHARPIRRGARTPAQRREEEDFLRREGYIY